MNQKEHIGNDDVEQRGSSGGTSGLEPLSVCPVCGESGLKRLSRPTVVIGELQWANSLKKTGLVRCRSCGLAFVNPRLTFETLMEFYETPGYEYHGEVSGLEISYKERMRIFEPFAARKRLLDVGCGGGSFLHYLKGSAWDVSGVEPSSVGREHAMKAGNQISEDISDIPQSEVGYDVVTLWHVLEHVPSLAHTLAQVRTVLNDNGIAVIEVPNQCSARAFVMRLFPWMDRSDSSYRAFPIHLYAFRKKALVQLLNDNGFFVEKVVTWHICLSNIFRFGHQKNVDAQSNLTAANNKNNFPCKRKRSVRVILSIVKRVFSLMDWGENFVVVARKR